MEKTSEELFQLAQSYDAKNWETSNQALSNKYRLKAIELYKQAAEKEDYVPAFFALYEVYLSGDCIEIDQEKALFWLKKAVDHEDIDALYQLAENYLYGSLLEYKQAFLIYLKLAQKNHLYVMKKVAYLYLQGIGTAIDEDQAKEWFLKAADIEEDADNLFYVAYDYEVGNLNTAQKAESYHKAVEYYKEASSRGQVEAKTNLACLYMASLGTEKNEEAAFYWHEQAATKGQVFSQYLLGLCYQQGLGITQDIEKAHYWYKQASTQINHQNGLELWLSYGNKYEYSECILHIANYYHQLFEKLENDEVQDQESRKLRSDSIFCDFLRSAKFFYCWQAAKLDISKLHYKRTISEAFEKKYDLSAAQTLAQLRLGEYYDEGLGIRLDPSEDKTCFYYPKQIMTDKNLCVYSKKNYYRCLNQPNLWSNSKGIVNRKIDREFKALYWYTKAAEKGNAQAQTNIADLYMCGWCLDDIDLEDEMSKDGAYSGSDKRLDKDYQQAFYWYQQAAKQDYAPACDMMGDMYSNGYGVDIDYEKAVHWYLKAAEQGDDDAQTSLGVMYRNGQGVNQDDSKAFYWYTQAAEQDNTCAQKNLAHFYQYGITVAIDYKKAFDLYQKAAEEGYDDAQNSLGVMYRNGQGVEQDDQQAFYWYEKAADQSNKYAQENLAYFYYHGITVDVDYERAFSLYRNSAEQGCLLAQYFLGFMYENAQGIEQDYEQAFYWYTKAAEQGDADAYNNLGWMYQQGLGKEVDYSQALLCYQKAAENKQLNAQVNLGWMYQHGQGVEQDYKQAFYWYTNAAEQGSASAKNNLGVLYEEGLGVEVNYQQAISWYRQASLQDLEVAKNNLKRLLSDID